MDFKPRMKISEWRKLIFIIEIFLTIILFNVGTSIGQLNNTVVKSKENTGSKNVDQINRNNFKKLMNKQDQETKKIQAKLPELIEKLKTGTFTERQAALKLIGSSKDRRAVRPLLELLDNPDHFKDYTPMHALYIIVNGCKDDPEFQKDYKDVLVETLKKRQKEKSENNSVFLYQLDDTQDSFPYFREEFKKGNSQLAVFYVNNFDGPNYVEEKAKPILLEALGMSPNVATHSAKALMTLRGFKDRSDLTDPVFNSMKRIIWDQGIDKSFRNDALLVLWKMRDSRSKEEVKKLSEVEKDKFLKYSLDSMLSDWDDLNKK